MDKILDAVLMKDTAPRSTIALTYGIAGVIAGLIFFKE